MLNIFKIQHDHWLKIQGSLSKDDYSVLSLKQTLANCLKGFLTPEYYKRKNLIEKGALVFSYIFKSRVSDDNRNNYVPFWVLFSPSNVVNDNPYVLKKCAMRLTDRSFSGCGKHLSKLLNEPYGDASYFELPTDITDGNLIYMSIVYLPRDIADKILLGYNPFLINKSISNEILYLQDKYWDNTFKSAYYSRRFM